MNRERDSRREVKDPELLGDILKKWVIQVKLNAGWKPFKVFAAWNQIVDEKIKEHVSDVSFARQTLVVEVDSPMYYFELANFEKAILLRKLQENCPEVYVKDIRFVCAGKPVL